MKNRNQIDQMVARGARPLAMNLIAEATGEPRDAVRAFLASEHGLNFARDVRMKMEMGRKLDAAVQSAVDLWMDSTIGRGTSLQFEIPIGLPWLKAFVIQAAMDEEFDAVR